MCFGSQYKLMKKGLNLIEFFTLKSKGIEEDFCCKV